MAPSYPHLSTREVGAVLEQAVRRIARYLARRGLLRDDDAQDGDGSGRDADHESEHEPTLAQGHAALCASAASGATLRRLDAAFIGDEVGKAGGLRRIAELHASSMKLLARDTKDFAIQEQADLLMALLAATR